MVGVDIKSNGKDDADCEIEFTIIVPVYNVEKYLDECINSILRQNYPSIEIILVDDGSTDRSGEICDTYKQQNPYIIVIHQDNGGLSNARNSGIRKATGDYLLFIDSDDFISEGSLHNIRIAVINQEKPDLIFLNAEKLFPTGEKCQLEKPMDLNRIYNRDRREVLSYLAERKKYPGSSCTKLVSRKLILQYNLFFEIGKTSEDLDWTRKLIMTAQSFGYCDGRYYNYRQNRAGSITNIKTQKNLNDLCEIVHTWVAASSECPEWQRKVLLSFSCYEYKIILTNYSSLDCSEHTKNLFWLKKNKYLLKFKRDMDIILIRIAVNIVGLKLTSKILYHFIKWRKKWFGE